MADTAQHDPLLQVHRRLDAHDSRIQTLETRQAVAAVEAENIQKSLAKIEGGIGWLLKLVIGGIIAGVVAFLIRGGFHVG
ncbi:hemolysin XhlA family protein [Paracoccus pantotrophus]|uniref:hemolysin XhlA family protein n=1 Tax=Paracoccus pantotrophus TaxID=82367 RepID=UPI0004B22EDE|nr:hemolysin XhlA family protein [Paracoccus pantotrophus]